MNIWLLTIGEPAPVPGDDSSRIYRTGQFSFGLVSRGHNVVWWASAFDHPRKKFLFDKTTPYDLTQNLKVVSLKSRGYKSNISLGRFLDEIEVAKEFQTWSPKFDRPDVIICNARSMFLSDAVVKFGRENNVPVILDCRDMWPDIFPWAVPKPIRFAFELALYPFDNIARRNFKRSTAIIGITEDFLRWGLQKAGRARTELDEVFPFAYSKNKVNSSYIRDAQKFWDDHNVTDDPEVFYIAFIGTIANSLDVRSIIDAASDSRIRELPIRFVIAGAGDKLVELQKASIDLNNIIWPGWLNAAQISVLMDRAYLGIDPMPNRFDFLASVNNKAIEYWSGGLPILSSPDIGALAKILKETNTGLSYRYGDGKHLASLVLEIVKDRQRHKQMSANAVSFFEKNFELEIVVDRFEQYLR